MKVFCIDINNSNYNKIKELNYIPVGLGQDNFDDNWLRDNTGVNISHKNPYYGEYTFHYWLWKNYLEKIENQEWLGFCAYRRFWSNENNKYEIKNKRDFLSRIPIEWENFNVILLSQVVRTFVSIDSRLFRIYVYGHFRNTFLTLSNCLKRSLRLLKFN